MANIVSKTALKTDMSVGIVVPSFPRADFTPYLRNISDKLLESRIRPNIYVQIAPLVDKEKSPEQYARMETAFEAINSMENAHATYGSAPMSLRIHEGFDLAYKSNDAIMFTCDDFDHLVEDFPGFVRDIGGENGMVLGKWDEESKFYLPKPMYINEAGISCMYSYVKEEHPSGIKPDAQNLDDFIAKAEAIGTFTQIYIGIMGIASGKWAEIREQMHWLFSKNEESRKSMQWVGGEAAVPLAAHSLGIKVASYVVKKRFEHPIDLDSEGQEKFKNGRAVQFKSGVPVILEFCKKYTPGKLESLQEFAKSVEDKILNSDFHWPGGTRPSKWNKDVRTNF